MIAAVWVVLTIIACVSVAYGLTVWAQWRWDAAIPEEFVQCDCATCLDWAYSETNR